MRLFLRYIAGGYSKLQARAAESMSSVG